MSGICMLRWVITTYRSSCDLMVVALIVGSHEGESLYGAREDPGFGDGEEQYQGKDCES